MRRWRDRLRWVRRQVLRNGMWTGKQKGKEMERGVRKWRKERA